MRGSFLMRGGDPLTALGKTEELSLCLLPGPVGSPVPGPGNPEERAGQPEARQLICEHSGGQRGGSDPAADHLRRGRRRAAGRGGEKIVVLICFRRTVCRPEKEQKFSAGKGCFFLSNMILCDAMVF